MNRWPGPSDPRRTGNESLLTCTMTWTRPLAARTSLPAVAEPASQTLLQVSVRIGNDDVVRPILDMYPELHVRRIGFPSGPGRNDAESNNT